MNDEQMFQNAKKLAQLNVPPHEEKSFCDQLQKMIHFVEKLNELNTENIPPTAHIFPIKNVFRKDQSQTVFNRSVFLKLAPESDGDFFIVPSVISE